MRDEKTAEKSILKEALKDANKINLIAIASMSFMCIVCEILNEINVFGAPKILMRFTISMAFIIFSIPLLMYIFNDIFRSCPNKIIYERYFKIIILLTVFLAITLLTVMLSFHTTLLLTIPPIMAVQYRYSKRTFIIVLIATIIMVPITIYGSYFFGLADRNLLKVSLTNAEAVSIKKRFEIATPKRMIELNYHYVLPLMFCIVLIDILAFGISTRNEDMLKKQIALTEEARIEMERRSLMQSRVIEDLAAVIETRDAGTGEHILRTKLYVKMILNEMKKDEKYSDILTDEYIENITNSAPLHDVGKIAITDKVLLKPGRLTEEEFEEMKKHSSKGGEMILNIFSNLDDEKLSEISYDIAMSHHEKWDGSGYPNGLSGKDIPFPARVMAVADVYDALTSKRVYKDSMPPEKAFDIIISGSGTQFDPDIIENVIRIKDDLINYVKENSPKS